MKHFIHLKDISAKTLRRILVDAKKVILSIPFLSSSNFSKSLSYPITLNFLEKAFAKGNPT